MKSIQLTTALIALFICGVVADASIIEFTDKDAWFDAVGDVTTIDFTEYDHLTQITDQYADSGMIVTSPLFVVEHSGLFPNDGHGVTTPNDPQFNGWWAKFDKPMNWLATDYPGIIMFDLYYQGDYIASTSLFSHGGLVGNFAGFISEHPFDEVHVYRPGLFGPTAPVDDLHFGAIPAPGALGLLALAGLLTPRRRRRGRS